MGDCRGTVESVPGVYRIDTTIILWKDSKPRALLGAYGDSGSQIWTWSADHLGATTSSAKELADASARRCACTTVENRMLLSSSLAPAPFAPVPLASASMSDEEARGRWRSEEEQEERRRAEDPMCRTRNRRRVWAWRGLQGRREKNTAKKWKSGDGDA